MSNIVITTSSFGKEDAAPLQTLREAGYETIINPYGRKLSEDEVLDILLETKPVGMISGIEPLTARVLERAENLKVISRCGIGLDNIDLDAARNRGIVVLNTPDAPTQAVAELTVGLIFDMLRQISLADRELRKRHWRKETGRLLRGRAVGIIGLGRIGRRVAEMLLGLGAKVVGADVKPEFEWLKRMHIPLVSLGELLSSSEIVCLHVSSTADTGCIIGRRELAAMRREACLVNMSRGAVLDEDALYESLNNGSLSGAALDVFTEEPYRGPLVSLDNVVLTPHIGSYSRESRAEMEMEAVGNLLRALAGERNQAQR